MDFSCLSEEEILYELALRHIVNVGSLTHRNKVLKLKTLWQDEVEGNILHESSTHVMSPTVNIETCSAAINQLHTLVDSVSRSKNKLDISNTKSRLLHYAVRLRIIDPPEFLSDALDSLRSIVKDLLVKVDNISVNVAGDSANIDSASSSPGVVDQSQEGSAAVNDVAGAASGFLCRPDTNDPNTTLPVPVHPNAGRGRGRGLNPQQSTGAIPKPHNKHRERRESNGQDNVTSYVRRVSCRLRAVIAVENTNG